MTQASVRLRPYGTISGAVLTRARLPIARIFGEIPAAKELGQERQMLDASFPKVRSRLRHPFHSHLH